MAEIVPEKESEMPVVDKPFPIPTQETTHISGGPAEPVPSIRISGNNFDQIPDVEPQEELEIDLQEEADIEEPEIEVTEAQETISESMPVVILTPGNEEIASTEPTEPIAKRDEAVQAYLDFIESSVKKLGGWIKDGFIFCWDYIKKI